MRLVALGSLILLVVAAITAQSPALPPDHPALAPQPTRDSAAALTEQFSPSADGPAAAPIPRRNFIDKAIFGKMDRDNIPHAALAGDEEFFRRIHIDLTGRTPHDDQLRAFLADTDPEKRDKLIDELASSPAYESKLAYFFGDLYKNAWNRIGNDGKNVFHKWIKDNIHLDRPYNEMVTEMLTASAISNWYVGPASYVARWVVLGANCDEEIHEDTADEEVIHSVKQFLGVDLSCVSCHNGANHLEKINLWLSRQKRAELWQTAAFFGKTQVLRRTERSTAQDEYSIDDNGPGYDASAESVIRVQRNGPKGYLDPAFIFTHEPADPTQNLRTQFARMLTENRQFARATVNLLWAQMFGVGIVDPPLDFDLARLDPAHPPPAPWTLQPSHPELLEQLAQYFIDNHYSLRSVIKLIAQSNAYQLSSGFPGEWKAAYAPYFARHFVRRMKAEEIHDSLVNATNLFTQIPIPGTGQRARFALDLYDPEDAQRSRDPEIKEIHFFLESFGQENREYSERTNDGAITQAVLLMNSPFVLRQVKAAQGSYLAGLLKEQIPDDQKITRLFQRFLTRNPSQQEIAQATDIVLSSEKGWEDLQWLLVNKVEFVHNY